MQDELFTIVRTPKGIRILEPTEDGVYPGQRVRIGALPSEVSPQEEAFVMSYQWFQELQGHWTETFLALKMGLRDCLCKFGHLEDVYMILD